MADGFSANSDMCHGPLAKKMLLFTLPLVLSSMLQLLFNAADVIVVGRFAGSESLAAVGSTGALVNLITNLFIGLSVGGNVVVAHSLGAGKDKDVSDTVHTAMTLSIFGGVILTLIGVPLSKLALELMGSPDDVIDLSALYLKIYFLGMPAMMIYNFGSAILNAGGDTKRPLYFLSAAGVINVIFNLIFVIVFSWGVAGVAAATVISQIVSAVLVLICLIREKGNLRLEIKKLGINTAKFKRIMKIGIPAGLQGMVFSLSNIVLQSAINSFGSTVMAGSAAAQNIEGFIFVAMNAFSRTVLTFVGQNSGASEYKRVKKIYILCSAYVVITGLVLSILALIFGRELIGIYSADANVINEGYIRLGFICSTYFFCGLMDVSAGSLRGMGYSITPMIVSLLGACGFRILWVYTIFAASHTTSTLFLSYPVSWIITYAAQLICFVIIFRHVQKNCINKIT